MDAQSSPTLARDPTNPDRVVITSRVDRPDFTAAVYLSSDGGRVWRTGALQPPPEGEKLYAPKATFGPDGTLHVLFATLSGPGNGPDGLWIESSRDGGLSFLPPTRVAGAYAFQAGLAVDPDSGRLFAAWLQSDAEATKCNLCFTRTGLPVVSTYSDDGGRSWTEPVQVSDPGRERVGAPYLAVAEDGNPLVLYMDYRSDRVDWENEPGAYEGKFALVLARSGDRGATFRPGGVVDTDVVPLDRFLVYLPVRPGLAVDSDRMVVTWQDGRFGDADVLARVSEDDGETWDDPVRVNDDRRGNGVLQDLPTASIAGNGRIDVLYYDRGLDARGGNSDVMLASSSDGGSSFGSARRVSTQSSNRDIGPQGSPFSEEADFGSSIALASFDEGALAAWTDTRDATPDSGGQDIFFATVPIEGDGGLADALVALGVGGVALGLAGGALIVTSRRRRAAPPGGAGDAAPDGPGPADQAGDADRPEATREVASSPSEASRVVWPSLRDPRWGQIASLSAFTLVGLTVLDFAISLVQAAAVVGTSAATEVALGWRARRRWVFPASALISGLSLVLLLRADGVGIFVVAGLATVLSKELIRARGKHIFNPSNFAVVAMILLFGNGAGVAPGQWGSSWVLLFLLANAGVYVIFSVHRFHVVTTFLGSYLAFEAVRLGLTDSLANLDDQVATASVLLFAFFMITDPRTSPTTAGGRYVYAAATAALASVLAALEVRAGLFIALACLCALVPPLDAVSERLLGRRLEAFDWPGAVRQQALSR